MPKSNPKLIFQKFSLRFFDLEYEQGYLKYSSQFTLQNFTYFFLYCILAIFIAIMKNTLNSVSQLKNCMLLIVLTLYFSFFKKYGAHNKFYLDFGFITLIVSFYLLHLLVFFPPIFLNFPGINSYYLGSAIESLRIFLFTSKADWRLVVLGNIIMNSFNTYEFLMNSKIILKENIFSFLFPFLMVNSFPIFSYFYERNLRQIFYQNLQYQKTLESFEYLIKHAFPNQIVIINEEKNDLLFCNEATQNFFKTDENKKIFNEIKTLQLTDLNGQSPIKDIPEPLLKKDLCETIINYDKISADDNNFMAYEGCLYHSKKEKKEIYSETSFDIKLGKIRWKNHSAFLMILTDISPLKLIQKLKEIDSYKDMLLATVSHDLRTPLNCLMGMLELIYERIIEKKTRKYIKMASRSAHLLLFMINDILDYSQIKNNKFSLNSKLYEVSCIVNEVIDLVKFQCRKKKISFMLDVKKETFEMKIIVDQLRLKQILLNLLGNALKFTTTGYVKLQISLIVNYSKKYLNFKVEDTGVGIKQKNIPKLFHLFGKMPQKRPEMNSTGVGLGLVISKRLAELLCSDEFGGVCVNSEYGKGSTFSFNIPLAPRIEGDDVGGEEDRFDESKLKKRSSRSMNLKDIDAKSASFQSLGSLGSITFNNHQRVKKMIKNILVVDDDQTNIFVIKQYLDKFSYSYETAFNGKEGIEQLIINKNFDLIIMDCNMPIMNGFEASKIIKKMIHDKVIPKIPILALTANVSIKDIEDCRESGMDYYLSKPVSKKNFKEMLENIFNIKIVEKMINF